jgi:hypothetical protein
MLPPALNELLQTVTAFGPGITGSSVKVPDNHGRTAAKSLSFAKKPIPRWTLQGAVFFVERRHAKAKNRDIMTSQRHF